MHHLVAASFNLCYDFYFKGTDYVEPTDFKACWDLVCASQRARKDKKKKQEDEERAERDRLEEEAYKQAEEEEKRRQRALIRSKRISVTADSPLQFSLKSPGRTPSPKW